MAGLLVAATVVFWTLGSGQRQWWAIYVEMPPTSPVTGTAAGTEAERTASGDMKSREGEPRTANTDPTNTVDTNKMELTRDIYTSFMRQQETRQQTEHEQESIV